MQSKIIIGLGNPGLEYENTRHNIGFAVLDTFGEKFQIVGKQQDKLLSWCGKGKVKLGNEEFNLVLCWPTTFINNSGDAVARLLKWYKLGTESLIVVHDDVALKLGKIRVVYNSSAAGHHGIESIIEKLGGTKEFIRLRIGIGPDPGGDKRKDYVLRKFLPDEHDLIKKVTSTSIQALETIITKDVGEAMNKFNGIDLI